VEKVNGKSYTQLTNSALTCHQLAREKLGGRLIFAATADEERGRKEGIKYLI
jgi:hypothetical protein